MAEIPIEDLRVDSWFAKKLPQTSDRELQALADDIRKRGLLVDLLITEDGLLLDGHRRLQAAKLAGLSHVPVRRISVAGETTWPKAIALAVNLHRRHLNEAQRANLGSSLLRIERKKAHQRQLDGQRAGGLHGGRARPHPKLPGERKPEAMRATDEAARAVGVSRQTFERVEKIKKLDPELTQRVLTGNISVAAAYRKLRVAEIRDRSKSEQQRSPGIVRDLESVAGRYRCIYADPPWEYHDSGNRGVAARHYPTMPLEEIVSLPAGNLAHPEGCHLWLWTTWPMIREAAPHRVLQSWGLRWVGELLWDKETLGLGRWFRGRTEVLIFAVKDDLPLLSDCADPVVRTKRTGHSVKPEKFYEIIEELSPGPRIELFARKARKGWDRWGWEAGTRGTPR
jgi:N6-adenosine-specific RNA methylase IME4